MLVILSLIKFFLAVLLFPVVIGVVVGLLHMIESLGDLSRYFIWGAGSYVILNLFLHPMQSFQRFVQKVFSEILKFSPFLASHMPLFIPVLPVLLLLILYILESFGRPGLLQDYIIFAVGFFLSMHMVLTAKDLFEEDTSGFKAHYLFMMSLVFIVTLSLTVLLLDLNFQRVDFMDFFRDAMDVVTDIYKRFGRFLVLPVKKA